MPRALGSLELLLNRDHPEVAMAHFRRAFDLGDRTRNVIGTLVAYYRERNDLSQASDLLAKVSSDKPALISGELARPLLHVVRTVDEALTGLGAQSPHFEPLDSNL